jgi:hypothetical protein
MPANPACRLFVILARDADAGVILHRGPSKWVQIIKGHTRNDTFEDGAWFHGHQIRNPLPRGPDTWIAVKNEASNAESVRLPHTYGDRIDGWTHQPANADRSLRH